MAPTNFGCFLGVDPGLHGGFALISNDEIAQAWPMPTTFRRGKEIVDEPAVGSLFKTRLHPAGIAYCVIEHVHSMKGQGVASMFKFGRNAGLLIGLLIAHEIKFEETVPEIWQRSLGIRARVKAPKGRGLFINFEREETKSQYKKRLLAAAKQLFPSAFTGKSNEESLKIADALLIAEYTKRARTGYLGRPIL